MGDDDQRLIKKMMFSTEQKSLALLFVRQLVDRNYSSAYQLLSQPLQQQISCEQLQRDFEAMIPSDWGALTLSL